MTHHVDGVGWWLSLVPAGADGAAAPWTSRSTGDPRHRPPRSCSRELSGQLRARHLPADRGWRWPGARTPSPPTTPTADPAELAILDGLRRHRRSWPPVAPDADGDGWLVEVFLDELSGAGQEMAGVLRLLVLAALHPLPL